MSSVTAVITTHARPQVVREALRSVCAETYPNLECVVVDDGGTYESPADQSRVPTRVVRGRSLGVASARNLGLAAARGEFVIFLDDDDVALPHRITTLMDAARRFGADVCYGMTRRAVAGSSPAFPAVPTGVIPGPVGFCDVLACAPHVNSVLVRTSTLRSIGGFDAGAHHFDDWSAWLRLADRGVGMGCVGEVVAEWRVHEEGLTGKVAQAGAMKSRLLAVFDRLQGQLSAAGARGVADAKHHIAGADIVTYDDYAGAMTTERARLHASGTCFGDRLPARFRRDLARVARDRVGKTVTAGPP
jgi:GT2 family glycosyltransferase